MKQKTSRYPPLIAMAVPIILVLAVLPSALNLPQSNPGTTLEYAPVPPDDSTNAAPQGNLSSLSLASTSQLADEVPQAGGPQTAGRNPRTKRCVGNPPRQTADLLSPPCVAFFEGDNFGATHRGVTRDEVRILIARDGGFAGTGTSRGSEPAPANTYKDIDDPPSEDDNIDVRVLRAFQRYFNDRYQAYGRKVHFFLHLGADTNSTTITPELRRSQAVDAIKRIDPFASFAYHGAYQDEYIDVAAQRKVLNFGSRLGRSAETFRRYPGFIWGYLPSIEQQAKLFSSYVCTRVRPFRVSASGNAGENGKPRTYGLLRLVNAARENIELFATEAKKRLEACGVRFAAEGTYSVSNSFTSVGNSQDAAQNMAEFQLAGVTTVIWPQGYEVAHSKAAAQIGYFPEWVVAGDLQFDGYGPSLFQDQDAWDRHAWVVTSTSIFGRIEDTSCYQALTEAEPDMPATDRTYACRVARTYYEDLRQLFTGIQVAGPRLTPATIDKGFHAIPAHPSSSPTTPACYYEPGDYTCVKDAVSQWWDRDGPNASSLRGCYRLADAGRRFTALSFPRRDGLGRMSPSDSCNGFQGGVGGVA